MLFIDLDQFKQVNDTLGHPCGDQLLCAVADRLRAMLRPEDFVARFGGDEFVVFQQNIKSNEEAAVLARRIVEHLSERYKIDNHLVEIGASVGIAMTGPGVSADTLLKNADMALYRAKADGRGTFCFFRDEMAQTVEARRILELDLRKALANEEFELFYQPLVNLKSGRIATCEALLRWNHPVRGTVSPIDIIPVAEDMGLIVDLGRWILRKACMECMKWPEAVSVAVNFSPQQFHQRDVLSEVRYALEVSGLPADRLEIEITESSLLRNTQLTHDVLSQLHALGVRISLDDFGTGYSSLSYLHNFPLQKVKIDRSFLEGIDTDRPLTLLRGVARLSADLGMSVVVEGIETNEQLELISADGTVTEAQGYLFSRPVPAVRVRQLLNASHGRRLPDEQGADAAVTIDRLRLRRLRAKFRLPAAQSGPMIKMPQVNPNLLMALHFVKKLLIFLSTRRSCLGSCKEYQMRSAAEPTSAALWTEFGPVGSSRLSSGADARGKGRDLQPAVPGLSPRGGGPALRRRARHRSI